MLTSIKKIYDLLDSEKKKVYFLIMLFFLLSLFDLFGISIIAPYIKLINNQNSHNIAEVQKIFISIGMNLNFKEIIILTGILLSLIFIIKSLVSIIVHRVIINFAFSQRLRLANGF